MFSIGTKMSTEETTIAFNRKPSKWVSLTNYDLDGATSAILMNRMYNFTKVFACGYGKLDFNISKAISHASRDNGVTGIVVTDWSLTLDQYKRLESFFDVVIYIDHHPTSQEVYEYMDKPLDVVLCAGAQCARYIHDRGYRLSADDKSLVGATNAYDNWKLENKQFQLGKDLTDLFYNINLWEFIKRFEEGFSGFNEDELHFIRQRQKEREEGLAAGIYEDVTGDHHTDKKSLVAILESSEVTNDVSLYKPGYNRYFIFYPSRDTGAISMSIRTTDCPDFAVGKTLQELGALLGEDEVVSSGGHDSAGAINFRNDDINYILNMVEEYITK